MRFEVTKVETMGDKIRVDAQEVAAPQTRSMLRVTIDLPLRRARAFHIGRVFRLEARPR